MAFKLACNPRFDPSAPVYTIAQVAAALNRKRQGIARALSRVPATGSRMMHGSQAAAWHFLALPEALQSELTALAARRGFGQGIAAAQEMLAARPRQWAPRVAVAEADPADIEKAAKLRAVIEPFAAGEKLETRSQAEFEAAGVAAYTRHFGHSISGRWFRALYDRTVKRDGGAENFSRLELYLDDSASPAPRPAPSDAPAMAAHKVGLAEVLSALANPARPSAEERAYLFAAAFRHLEGRAAGMKGRAAQVEFKSTLITYLGQAAPALARNRGALKRSFNLKYAAWQEGGADALADRRPAASGNFSKHDFTSDLEKIRNEAILHGGSESLAHRKLRQSGQLSEAFANHYKFDPRKHKSYVPRPVRDAITGQVNMCAPLHRGPHEAKMRGPHIPRDWSNVHPGDWFSADDVTWNNYYFDPASPRQPMRGECLVIHDRVRCKKVQRNDFLVFFDIIYLVI
ncbi:MAG TPA: hypothetical protein VGO59_00620 [Verrucomicrobiae bacterium]|jgi:hypothetical protein